MASKTLLVYAGLVYAPDAQRSARILAAARAAHTVSVAWARAGNMGSCRRRCVRGADQRRVQGENRIGSDDEKGAGSLWVIIAYWVHSR